MSFSQRKQEQQQYRNHFHYCREHSSTTATTDTLRSYGTHRDRQTAQPPGSQLLNTVNNQQQQQHPHFNPFTHFNNGPQSHSKDLGHIPHVAHNRGLPSRYTMRLRLRILQQPVPLSNPRSRLRNHGRLLRPLHISSQQTHLFLQSSNSTRRPHHNGPRRPPQRLSALAHGHGWGAVYRGVFDHCVEMPERISGYLSRCHI